MLVELKKRLEDELHEGDTFCAEVCERIDAHIANYNSHIGDLEVLKAWVKDSMRVRADAIRALVNGNPAAPAPVVAIVNMPPKASANA